MRSQGKIYGIMNLENGQYFTGTDKQGGPEYSFLASRAKRYSGYFVRRVTAVLKTVTGVKHQLKRID